MPDSDLMAPVADTASLLTTSLEHVWSVSGGSEMSAKSLTPLNVARSLIEVGALRNLVIVSM